MNARGFGRIAARAAVVVGAAAGLVLTACPGPSRSGVVAPVPAAGAITDAALAAQIATYARAAEANPSDGNAWARLAMTYHVHELLPLAEAAYAKALEADPTQTRWRWFRAGALEMTARFDEALVEATRVRREAPAYAPAAVTVAQWLLAHGRTDEATEWARAATDADPNDPGCWIIAALVHHDRGEYALGETAARRALRLPLGHRPQEAYAHFVLGRCLAGLGRAEEAKREIARGRNGDGRFPVMDRWKRELNDYLVGFTALLAAAHGDLMAGEGPSIVGVFQELHRRDPGHMQVSGELAMALRRSNRLDEAVAVLDEALALHPEQPWLLLQLALTKELKGERDEAMRLLDRGVAAGPDQGELHEEKGMMLLRLGRRDEAVQAFERAVTVEPDRSWTLVHAGVAMLEDSSLDAAAGYFRRCGELDPGNADVYAGLAIVAARRRDLPEADRLIGIARHLDSRNTVLTQVAATEIDAARRK